MGKQAERMCYARAQGSRRFRAMAGLGAWAALLVSALVVPRSVGSDIVNNKGSDNLENAMEHCPAYAVDRELVDRDKAISYYCAYLEEYPADEYPNLVNRAKVLTQIGLLYAQYKDPTRPEVRPDYGRAVQYFMKAIEADPTFICVETIYARTNLASLAGSPEGRMRERMAVYKWLSELTDERLEASVRRELESQKRVVIEDDSAPEQERAVLRAIGVRQYQESIEEMLKREIKTLRSLVDRTSQTLCVNLVADASATSNPVVTLSEVIRVLDGHPPARLARQELREGVQSEILDPK